jgi:hypothetical protein
MRSYPVRVAVHDWVFEVQVSRALAVNLTVSRKVPAALSAPDGATLWKLPRNVEVNVAGWPETTPCRVVVAVKDPFGWMAVAAIAKGSGIALPPGAHARLTEGIAMCCSLVRLEETENVSGWSFCGFKPL